MLHLFTDFWQIFFYFISFSVQNYFDILFMKEMRASWQPEFKNHTCSTMKKMKN